MNNRFMILMLVLVGCSRADSEPTSRHRQSRLPIEAAKKVGDPCTDRDGWTPVEFATLPAPAGPVQIGDPVEATQVPEGHVDYHQVEPGVGYCISAGGEYPRGYFTSNCRTDADCPGGTRCGGSFCVVTCTRNIDCQAPTRCGPPAGANGIRWCRWYDNPAFRMSAR